MPTIFAAENFSMSRTIYITRRERFAAAHKLSKESWSDEKNLEVFGKCSNPNWHGHNYELFVTVKGTVSEDTGYLMDLKVLSDIIQQRVIDHVDHKNINLDTPFMKGKMTSTENLCMAIWDELSAPISEHGAQLHCVRLKETENNEAEFYG